MTAKPRHKDWLAWFIWLTLLLAAAGAARLALDIGRPYGGYLEEYLPFWSDRLQINSDTPAWWPNVSRADLIEHGLLRLDGRPYRPARAAVFAAAHARGEHFVTLTIDRGGADVDEQVPLVVFTWSDYLDVKFPAAIVGLCLWLLAVVLYATESESPLNRVAAWTFCLMASIMWLTWPSLFWADGWLARLIDATSLAVAWPFTGAALLHFALAFPRPSRLLSRPLLFGVYGLAAAVGLAWGGARTAIWIAGWSPRLGDVEYFGFDWSIKYLLGAGLAALAARAAWNWVRGGNEPRLRRQMSIVFLGLALASPTMAIFLLDMWGRVSRLYIDDLDLRYLLLAIPLAYAYVILRHRAFRGAHPLFLAVFVIASSGLWASTGAWAIRRLQPQPISPSVLSLFLPLFALATLVGAFWATQASWRGVFARLLHWEQRSYASVRSFGHRLLNVQADQMALAGAIAKALVAEVEVAQAGVWLWDDAAGRFNLASQAGAWPQPAPPTLSPPPSVWAGGQRVRRGPERAGAGQGRPDWLAALWASGAEAAVLLAAPDHGIGLLALGKHQDEETFDARDLAIFDLIGQQVSLFLLTARQVDQLRQVPHRLAEMQTRERFRIARDLHDTVQQRLGGLQPMLEAGQVYVRTDPVKVDRLLERCMEEVEHAAQVLTRLRHDLAPPELVAARAPAAAFRALADRFQQRTGIAVRVALPDDVDAFLPSGVCQELYLVIQQALDNIAAHARAGQVNLCLRREDNRMLFVVRDDGQGFSEEQRQAARERGSLGLLSMESRVAGLGGEIAVTSSPGAGARVAGWVPLAG